MERELKTKERIKSKDVGRKKLPNLVIWTRFIFPVVLFEYICVISLVFKDIEDASLETFWHDARKIFAHVDDASKSYLAKMKRENIDLQASFADVRLSSSLF